MSKLFSRLNSKSNWNKPWSLPIGLSGIAFLCLPLILHSNSAQAQVYGRGPSLGFYNPGAIGAESFQPSSGVTCPTPSFMVGGYGAGGNDWSDNYVPNYASSSAGINNYGIAAGLRVPLGAGELTRSCRKFAEARAELEHLNTQNFRRNSQIALFRQCNWLADNLVKMDQKGFNNPAFSSLKACAELDYEPAQGIINRGGKPVQGNSSLGSKENGPPESQVLITTPPTLQIERNDAGRSR